MDRHEQYSDLKGGKISDGRVQVDDDPTDYRFDVAGVAGIAVSVVSRVAAVVAVAEGGSPLQVFVVGAGLQLVRCFGGRCRARFDRLPGCGRLLRGRDGRHDRNEGDEGEEQGLADEQLGSLGMSPQR
uniref:Uncharacterized protein n=1 Tax=Anopheles melas TaxID=34690 RepID=A0A182UA78_9DIPT